MVDEIDIEVRKIQLEAAKLDLEAKRTDLGRRPSDLRNAFTNPVAVAAIIAAIVTICTAIVSSVVTWHQTTLARQKADFDQLLEAKKAERQTELEERKYESQLIFDAVRTDNPSQSATNLKFLVDTGLIKGSTAPRLEEYLASHPTRDVKTLPV